MNILYFAHSVLNRGGDRLVLEYLNHLADAGHEVTVKTGTMDTVFAVHPSIRVQKINFRSKAGTLFSALFQKQTADCIIATIIPVAFFLCARNREKVIYYAQADDREYYNNMLLRKIIDLIYLQYFRACKPVISMSQHLTDIFKKRFKLTSLYTIHSGIDHAIFYPDFDKNILNFKGKKKAVVFMARGDAYRKGYDIARSVFETIGEHPANNMELWVCGNHLDGSRYPFTLRNFGTVTDSRLRQILSAADIFFYPSRHEGFGLFPLEAMACGCVVVTTEAIPYAKTTPSILTSKINDVHDLTCNISKLLIDQALLASLKKEAINESKKYDISTTKREFESALSNIMKERKICA